MNLHANFGVSVFYTSKDWRVHTNKSTEMFFILKGVYLSI